VAGAVLDATVAEHRAWEGLTVLDFSGGKLIVPQIGRATGSRVRVRVRAEDIMLAREEPRAISANNILAATVSAVRANDAGQADIQLICGETRLVARITRASAARLSLQPGMKVYAIIKSVIVDSSN
jgi:molybdate transport system ATP-binding protein